mmetsp:Transcript_59971/g.160663  ORF Transcript_59971/g.160663 Transcript_59971/m.160663 type:complete len:259 (+) Transcript_59971:86-862(+)
MQVLGLLLRVHPRLPARHPVPLQRHLPRPPAELPLQPHPRGLLPPPAAPRRLQAGGLVRVHLRGHRYRHQQVHRGRGAGAGGGGCGLHPGAPRGGAPGPGQHALESRGRRRGLRHRPPGRLRLRRQMHPALRLPAPALPRVHPPRRRGVEAPHRHPVPGHPVQGLCVPRPVPGRAAVDGGPRGPGGAGVGVVLGGQRACIGAVAAHAGGGGDGGPGHAGGGDAPRGLAHAGGPGGDAGAGRGRADLRGGGGGVGNERV